MGKSSGRVEHPVGCTLLGALLTAAAALTGCHGEQVDAAYGQLTASPSVVDFQRVALHDRHSLDLRFDNVGRSKVQVLSVTLETPNGAFSGQLPPRGGASIPPGGQSTLNVSFAPTVSGLANAKVVVQTANPIQPRLEIPVKGEGIDARARIVTPKLEFGRIEAQSTKSLPLVLENPTPLPIWVEGHFIGRDADEFAGSGMILEPGEQRALTVAFNPGADSSRLGAKQVLASVVPCRGCGAETVPVAAISLDKAVVVEPGAVDFGPWPHDSSVALPAVLHNISTEPMQVLGWKMAVAPELFGIATPSSPVMLAADGRQTLNVTFSAAVLGVDHGTLEYDVASKRNPTNPLPLTGFGGSPKVCILPSFFDFADTLKDFSIPPGPIPVGARVSTLVTIVNCGDANAPPLNLTGVTLEGTAATNADEFTLAPFTLKPLQSGESISFKAYFEPTRPGDARVALHVTTDVQSIRNTYAQFQGTGKTYPDCTITTTPASVDFGTVTSGLGGVLGVKLSNNGTNICAVKDIRIQNDGGGVFSLPGGVIEGDILLPGGYFTFQVAGSAPMTEGVYVGSIAMGQANGVTPLVTVPLTLHSVAQPCLVATPPFLDFGLDRPDCPAQPLTVRIANVCSTSVVVTNVTVGPGSTDSEFTLSPLGFALPQTLAPGALVSVQADYLAQVQGQSLSPLFISTSTLAAPFLVPLLGESSSSKPQVDSYIQAATNKLDVLFVVDNNATFAEQSRLPAAIPGFVSDVLAKQIDLHVGVTTTGVVPYGPSCPGGALGGEAGRLFPVDNSHPRILTSTTPNLTQQLQADVSVGVCSKNDEGLEAMRLALSAPLVDHADDPLTPQPNDGNLGFLRAEASLAVVFVTDAYDSSSDSVETYVHFLRSLKGINQPQRSQIYGLVPTHQVCAAENKPGSRYETAAEQSGGLAVSAVCTQDWTPLLQTVLSRGAGTQVQFPLSAKPKDATQIAVTVDGAPVAAGSTWHYDAGANAIVFANPPHASAAIQASYVKVCGT